jgi:hypothetical protein
MPISFEAPNKKWVLSGLLGEPRKRTIIVQSEDPSENRPAGRGQLGARRKARPPRGHSSEHFGTTRSVCQHDFSRYIPPSGQWEPAAYNFQLRATCANHVGDLACMHLESMCALQVPAQTHGFARPTGLKDRERTRRYASRVRTS